MVRYGLCELGEIVTKDIGLYKIADGIIKTQFGDFWADTLYSVISGAAHYLIDYGEEPRSKHPINNGEPFEQEYTSPKLKSTGESYKTPGYHPLPRLARYSHKNHPEPIQPFVLQKKDKFIETVIHVSKVRRPDKKIYLYTDGSWSYDVKYNKGYKCVLEVIRPIYLKPFKANLELFIDSLEKKYTY